MAKEYRHNHYVPRWYQKRFIPPGKTQQELFYLDRNPPVCKDKRGIRHQRNAVRRLGLKDCFVKEDLYTLNFGKLGSTVIEQNFFRPIDNNGRRAVEYFEGFAHPSADRRAFDDMIMYLSTQKLRTQKDLKWLKVQMERGSRDELLQAMVKLRQLYCAIWSECISLIADASQAQTKFILTDHPATVYNQGCGLRAAYCRGANDPDIRLHGTHTIFPFSLFHQFSGLDHAVRPPARASECPP